MGPVESLTGMLMCGLSAGFLFAIVTRLVALEDPALVDPSAGGSGCASDKAGEQTGTRQLQTENIRKEIVASGAGS